MPSDELYKLIIEQLRFEGNLIWTRTQAFLVLNGAIVAVFGLTDNQTLLGSDGSGVFRLFASFFGVLLCILWLLAVGRSRAYYKFWINKAMEVEADLGDTLEIKLIKDLDYAVMHDKGDDNPFNNPLARRGSITGVTRIIAIAFIVVWSLLAVVSLISYL